MFFYFYFLMGCLKSKDIDANLAFLKLYFTLHFIVIMAMLCFGVHISHCFGSNRVFSDYMTIIII